MINELVQKYPRTSIFVALQGIDFATTYLGLTVLGAHEVNPLVVALIHSIGIAGALVMFKGLGVLMALKIAETKSLWRANIIYGVVMCSNLTVLLYHFHKLLKLPGS